MRRTPWSWPMPGWRSFPGRTCGSTPRSSSKRPPPRFAPANPASSTGVIERYDGDLLPDDRYEDWAAEPRERLRRKYVEALRRSGSWERLADEEPHDEEAHRGLVRMWLDRGNRAAALRQYTRMQDLLARELGVRPSRESLALWSEIKAAAPPVPTAGPLVGRDGEIDTALARWASARAVAAASFWCRGRPESVRRASAMSWSSSRAPRMQSPSGLRPTWRRRRPRSGWPSRALGATLTERPELSDLLGREARDEAPAGPPSVLASGLSWREAATPGIERQLGRSRR